MATLLPPPKFSSLTSAGALLAGGRLYTYEAGTTTPLATYTDASGTTANANPVILDARGEANVWFDSSKLYKLALKTAADVTIWTVDNVGSASPVVPLDRVYAKTLPVGLVEPPPVFNDQLRLTRYCNGETVVYLQDPYDCIDFTKNPDTAINHYYVNYATGSNSDPGTSSADAWKTLAHAGQNAVSPAIIHIEDEWIGLLSISTAAGAYNDLDGNFKFVSDHASGHTRFTGVREDTLKADFNWNDEGDGCWSTSAATAGDPSYFTTLGFAMFDAKYPDERGGAMPIPDVTKIFSASELTDLGGPAAACIATPGTQYHDVTNSKKWVHLIDGREPDPADGWIYCHTGTFFTTVQNAASGGTLLFEGLHVYCNVGGSFASSFSHRHVTTDENTSRVGRKNCLVYGSSGNGLETYDAQVVVHSNCGGRYNRYDNFNYHSHHITGTKAEYVTAYEYNCWGHAAGYDGFIGQTDPGGSCNASTAHDSMHIERVNPQYGGGNGATIADVNGCVSVILGGNAGPPTGGNFKSCFWHDGYLGVGAHSGMYLWGVAGHDGGDATVRLLNNEAQAAGATGQIYIEYWRGQTDGTVTGTLKHWSGADL